jgi:tetratricopeptide (TPR) repeat protein
VRDPGHAGFALSPDYDDGRWIFTGDTSDVSGNVKAIPDLPTIVVAAAQVTLPVVGGSAERSGAAGRARDLPPAPSSEGGTSSHGTSSPASPGAPLPSTATPTVRERFNDYGIGLLLQRDLKGAEAAFRRVVEIDPGYADGYVNIARALIDEGDHRSASAELEKALAIDPKLPKTHYFYALTLKTLGRYEEALDHLRIASAAFPRDRVVLNQMGRILFLMRRHDEAIRTLQRTLEVDPEDLQAHYNLMLACRAKGDETAARTHEKLYARFKADESAQAITGPHRLEHPEDNNERLLVHEHEMVEATGKPAAYATRAAR